MLLPMVLDWAERRYFKARFVALEDIAKTNPELALMIGEHCKKLSLPGLRLAVVDTTSDELFSYGLWRTNPRLIIPDALLTQSDKSTGNFRQLKPNCRVSPIKTTRLCF